MHLTTFFSRWLSARSRHLRTQMRSELPLCLDREANRTSFPCKSGPTMLASNQVSISEMPEAFGRREEHFQRRFRQLAAGGWSFRAATVIARFECLIEAEPL